MKKLHLIVIALAMLALAPAAQAQCANCIGEICYWDEGAGGYFPAADCWFEWCPPCGCYTTGLCPPGFAAKANDLALEYRIASVEIRQGGVLVAHKTEEAPAVVAEKKLVRR